MKYTNKIKEINVTNVKKIKTNEININMKKIFCLSEGHNIFIAPLVI